MIIFCYWLFWSIWLFKAVLVVCVGGGSPTSGSLFAKFCSIINWMKYAWWNNINYSNHSKGLLSYLSVEKWLQPLNNFKVRLFLCNCKYWFLTFIRNIRITLSHVVFFYNCISFNLDILSIIGCLMSIIILCIIWQGKGISVEQLSVEMIVYRAITKCNNL